MATGVRESAPTKQELTAALKRARELTLRLLEPVSDEQLVAQLSPIMSPLVWDLLPAMRPRASGVGAGGAHRPRAAARLR
jgi:hypothetical protein